MTNRRQLLLRALGFADLVIMVGAFAFATWVLSQESLGQLLAVRLKLVNSILFLVLLVLWYLTFKAFDLYRLRRFSSPWNEAWTVLKATSVGAVAVLNAGFLFQVQLVTPQFIVLFWLSAIAATTLMRVLFRTLLERIRVRGRNISHVLIVGTNERARKYARSVRSRPELGYGVIGFVDDPWPGLEEFYREGEKLVVGIDELVEYLRGNVVDEVVMALPFSSAYGKSARIVSLCEEQGITVRFLSDIFNLNLAKSRVEMFQGEPVIVMRTGQMEGGGVVVKRALDFTLALVQLIILGPLLLGVALLIKRTSPGPVLFVQKRVGRNKRVFNLLKFRTMVEGAEARLAEIEELNEVSGPVFKIKNDPRVTPIGRILRKTSIDEMPQLLNVLIGDMSLVGPRPLPVRDFEGFDRDWHRRRFSVRPGITCLWQVSGRNSVPFEQWMELDMKYIDEWSLWMDLKILAKTIPAVLSGSGAA
ncbi:MAG: sugar transferase [bacterium]|nr:sugar transferase [bacterium]